MCLVTVYSIGNQFVITIKRFWLAHYFLKYTSITSQCFNSRVYLKSSLTEKIPKYKVFKAFLDKQTLPHQLDTQNMNGWPHSIKNTGMNSISCLATVRLFFLPICQRYSMIRSCTLYNVQCKFMWHVRFYSKLWRNITTYQRLIVFIEVWYFF